MNFLCFDLCTTKETCKYCHMEGVAVWSHIWLVCFDSTRPTIQTPLTSEGPFPVNEVVCLVMFLTCSAWKVCVHEPSSPWCPDFLIELECMGAACTVQSSLALLLITQVRFT